MNRRIGSHLLSAWDRTPSPRQTTDASRRRGYGLRSVSRGTSGLGGFGRGPRDAGREGEAAVAAETVRRGQPTRHTGGDPSELPQLGLEVGVGRRLGRERVECLGRGAVEGNDQEAPDDVGGRVRPLNLRDGEERDDEDGEGESRPPEPYHYRDSTPGTR